MLLLPRRPRNAGALRSILAGATASASKMLAGGSLHRCDTQLCIDKFSKRTSGLCGGMWQTSHTVGDSDRAYPKARNSSGATVLSHRVFGWGGKSSHTAPNIDRRAAKPGRREGAKAEKAVPFPAAVRRSKSFLASLRSTHSAG